MSSSRNPIHTEILDECKKLHDAKSHDYAQDDNVFSNFEYAAKVAEPFTDPVDKVFVTMIAIKLARLAELRKGKTPKHESIGDTLIDNVNYNAIWASRVIGGLRNITKVTPGSTEHYSCKCDHHLDYHDRLIHGGYGVCRSCQSSATLPVSEMCHQFRSKYDHMGNLI